MQVRGARTTSQNLEVFGRAETGVVYFKIVEPEPEKETLPFTPTITKRVGKATHFRTGRTNSRIRTL